MKTTLDAKSLLIGLLARAALVATFGATPEPRMSPQIGRYQVSGAGNSFAFAIDNGHRTSLVEPARGVCTAEAEVRTRP